MVGIGKLAHPEDRALREVLGTEIVGVPEPPLAHGRRHADLEHVAHGRGAVDPSPVPEPVVGEQHGPGRADHVLLAADVLVAADGHLADDPQVAARHVAGPTHLAGDLVREVEELDIERPARIDRGILVGRLRRLAEPVLLERRTRERDVQELVIEATSRPHQALDRSADVGQADQVADGRAHGEGLVERRARRDLGDVLRGGVGREALVDVVGNDPVEAQEATRGELRHLARGEQDGISHRTPPASRTRTRT